MPEPANVCREGDNTLAGKRVALVFVPGVMGTRIQFPQDDDKWDPDSNLNMYGWSREDADTKRRILDYRRRGVIFTDPSSTFDTNHASRVARGWGGLRWKSYGTILSAMESWSFGTNQTPVYAYGYDWRQPIQMLGVQMAADILGGTQSGHSQTATNSGRFGTGGLLAHAKAEKCILITHSMGGLVSRMALLGCPALREKTVAVMHGVQPATGGTTLYRRLITGAYAPLDGGDDTESKVFRNILGPEADSIAKMLSLCPGPFQLVPSDLLREACFQAGWSLATWTEFAEGRQPIHQLTADFLTALGQPETASPPGVVRSSLSGAIQGDMASRVSGVKIFHSKLGSWKYDNRTWAFYGTGVNTDHTVHCDLPPATYTHRTEGLIFKDHIYEAVDPSGKTVVLDKVADIDRRGYRPNPNPRNASPTAPIGFGPHGDGTVPRLSGAALFDPTETANLGSISKGNYDFAKNKQFSVPNLNHEPAYTESAPVRDLVQAWVRYVLGAF
ncbi:hypothetical protein PHYC_02608 [Phycisphaerales bacterium]|nr:hypothetical protein PHYC_02608 [Phycisphaerales bacterium]